MLANIMNTIWVLKKWFLILHVRENRTVMNVLIIPTSVVILSSCITVVLDHVWTPFITVLCRILLKHKAVCGSRGEVKLIMHPENKRHTERFTFTFDHLHHCLPRSWEHWSWLWWSVLWSECSFRALCIWQDSSFL